MKRLVLTFCISTFCILFSFAQKNLQTYYSNNIIFQKSTEDIDSIKFSNQISSFNYNDSSYNISIYAIDSIVFSDEWIDDSLILDETKVYITYNGSSVSVINPFENDSVEVAVSNANVTVNNSGSIKDIEYFVSGTTTNGSLTFNSNKRFTLTLNNASITNPDSAAIHVCIDKKVTVNLEGENTLVDGSNGEQKAAFDSKGNLVFSGWGTLNVTGNTKHAIYSSDDILLESGILNITSAVSDGLHAEEIYITGGTTTIENFGSDAIDCEGSNLNGIFQMTSGNVSITTSTSSVAGIKSDSTILVSGGKIVMTLMGLASKGLSSDQFIIVTGGTINMDISGATLLTATGSGYDPSYGIGFKSNGTISVTGGSTTLNLTGTGGKGLSADSDISINGGTMVITTTGNGASYTDSTGTTNSYTAACIKSDTNISILKGNITCKSSGTGGKGVSADGNIVIGISGNDNSLLTLTVATSGARFAVSSSSNSSSGPGSNRPGGNTGFGEDGSDYANSKAIKAAGNITIYSGNISVTTASDGAEGIEGKTSVSVYGGLIYAKCYDDCINSAGILLFNGGVSYCWSTGNDAIDSNYGKSGAITIKGGAVIALSTIGAPEEGLDADNNSYITISGGYIFSAGGSQGGSSNNTANASQAYAFVSSSVSYTTGKYYTIANSSGTNIFTFSVPATVSSSLSLISAPTMVSNTSYTIKYGTTEPTDYTSTFQGFYFGSSASGSTSVTSFSAN